ncbi:MAG TPA: cytochrome c oxidase assembly protein [Gaiellales bacterium]|nr:cytochrome c oxidase assembly protein [Gaiellales bacterium]
MAAVDHSVALSSFASSWTLDPGPLTAAAVGLALFAQAFVRLRRRGRADHAPWSRAVLFGLGVAVSVLPLVSPLDTIADSYLISAHMFEHVLLGDAGPALMVTAVRGPLAVFLLPGPVLRPIAHSHAVRGVLRFLLRPRVSLAAWILAMGTWHIPAAYDYTLTHQLVHDFEHVTFAIVGTLIWMQLVDPTHHHRLSVPQRLVFALVVFAAGQLLSDVFIFTLHPLYAAYAEQPARVLGLGPMLDQRLAGLVMMAEQTISLGICAVLLLRQSRRPAGRRPHSRRAVRTTA